MRRKEFNLKMLMFCSLAMAVMLAVAAIAADLPGHSVSVPESSGAAFGDHDTITLQVEGEVPWYVEDARCEYRIFPTGAMAPGIVVSGSVLQSPGGGEPGSPQPIADGVTLTASDSPLIPHDCDLSNDHSYTVIVYLQVPSQTVPGTWRNAASVTVTVVADGGTPDPGGGL